MNSLQWKKFLQWKFIAMKRKNSLHLYFWLFFKEFELFLKKKIIPQLNFLTKLTNKNVIKRLGRGIFGFQNPEIQELTTFQRNLGFSKRKSILFSLQIHCFIAMNEKCNDFTSIVCMLCLFIRMYIAYCILTTYLLIHFFVIHLFHLINF